MEALVSLVLLLAIVGVSDGAWCVCRTDVSSSAQQKALDYACGAGADCNPILQNGACYNPNTVVSHCSYAANSYYQRKGQAQGSCDFSASATLTSTDPSGNGCTYPATSSAAGTSSGTPSSSTGTPSSSTGTPSTTTGGSTSTPSSFTPSIGSSGGVLGGLGPSGNGISTDTSDGGLLIVKAEMMMMKMIILFSFMAFLVRG